MKISISGTHGIGKSTICKKVAAKVKGVEVIKETFTCVKDFVQHPNTPQRDKAITDACNHLQKAAECMAEKRSKMVLCDRNYVDQFVYHYTNLANIEKHFVSWIQKQLLTYDRMFVICLSEEIPLEQKADGSRMMNLAFRKKVDAAMQRTYETLAKKYKNITFVQQRDQDKIVDAIVELFNQSCLLK